jgi:chromate transporter
LEVFWVFWVFLRLGLVSFGGPIAHIGYFRREFVEKRRWLTDARYAELVALCQVLPGPTSSQVGMALGLARAGLGGMLAAWLGFTLPSALIMISLGSWTRHAELVQDAYWVQGLQLAAVAVVAQALWSMTRSLCPDWQRKVLAGVVAALALVLPLALAQIILLLVCGALGALFARTPESLGDTAGLPEVPARTAQAALVLLVLALVLLPVANPELAGGTVGTFARYFRVGALVFGGGHVVLPLLEASVVATGAIPEHTFLAGYGAAQAVPGPLFTFAGFLGSAANTAPNGPWGGLVALVAIFAPSFLLVTVALPVWRFLRTHPGVGRALVGINAAVVGLLLAAWLNPLVAGTIRGPADALIALAGAWVLIRWSWPPWLVVLGTLLGAAAEHLI